MNPRVLIVDDCEDTLVTSAALLRMLDCETHTCPDANACIALAWDFLPHLILLDLAMPFQDGYSVARQIRAAHLQSELIAVTGFCDQATRLRCHEAGFDGFLVKPTPMEDLRRLISKVRCRLEASALV